MPAASKHLAPHHPWPRLWRVALGFILAPAVPALAFYGPTVSRMRNDLILVVLILVYWAYPITVALGIPAFLISPRLRYQFLFAVLVGGLIAAVPVTLLLLLPRGRGAEIGSCQTVIDGYRTLCGYVLVLKFSAFLFALGCIGGAVFWLCVVWRDPRLRPTPPQE